MTNINETVDWWTGEGSADSNQTPWNLNILPPPAVPAAEDIPLQIQIGATSRVRKYDEEFLPTISYTAPFLYTTDLLNYPAQVIAIAAEIWPYVHSEKIKGAIVQTHLAVWLDNVTHPGVSAGVVRLPKGHWDAQLSNEEFTSAQVLQDNLTGLILNIRNIAKY